MCEAEHPETGNQPQLGWFFWGWFCLSCACLALAGLSAHSQSSTPSGGALIVGKAMEATPINQPPDAIAQLNLRRQRSSQRNFDVANALRQRQIADETEKLLILARDLTLQVDAANADQLPPRLLREIEVIEILARDVQRKMTLTIGMD